MKIASAYKALCQDDKLFLKDIAQEVALLVAKPKTRMNHFRKQLREFAEKRRAWKTAVDAERKEKWRAGMGKPDNPLWAISPRSDARCFPYCGAKPVLGFYALLVIIHDKVLPNCPSIGKEVLPKELVNRIWGDLVTGANEEDRLIVPDIIYEPRRVIPSGRIEGFLQAVKDDIQATEKAGKKQQEPHNKPGTIAERFRFTVAQAWFDSRDLCLPQGAEANPVKILKALVEAHGQCVAFTILDDTSAKTASDFLRGKIRTINKALKKHKVPCTIKSRKWAGYVLAHTSKPT